MCIKSGEVEAGIKALFFLKRNLHLFTANGSAPRSSSHIIRRKSIKHMNAATSRLLKEFIWIKCDFIQDKSGGNTGASESLAFPAPPEHSVEMGNGKWLNRGLCEVKGERV